MKSRKTLKTFKSLDELSVESLGAIDDEREKTKPPKLKVPGDMNRGTAQDNCQKFADTRGFRDWGINE